MRLHYSLSPQVPSISPNTCFRHVPNKDKRATNLLNWIPQNFHKHRLALESRLLSIIAIHCDGTYYVGTSPHMWRIFAQQVCWHWRAFAREPRLSTAKAIRQRESLGVGDGTVRFHRVWSVVRDCYEMEDFAAQASLRDLKYFFRHLREVNPRLTGGRGFFGPAFRSSAISP